MPIVALRLELRFAGCGSAREKRRLLEDTINKLRRHFNVSAAEVDRLDDPAASVLAVAAVGRSRREAHDVLARVADALAVHPNAEVGAGTIRDLK